jgi:tripartite ATP-independent transporter DctP family solute receptor
LKSYFFSLNQFTEEAEKMKKKMFVCTLVIAVVLVGFVFAQAGQLKINFAHPLPPAHPNHLAAVKFAELVGKNSNGDIKVEVYPANQLGNAKQQVEGVMLGSIKIALVSPARIGLFQPEFAILECPYLFRDIEHLQKVLRGEIGQDLSGKLEKNRGLKIVALDWLYGTRHVTTEKTPIKNPSDLKGLLIRAPELPVYMETIKAMGATPAPVNFSDLYMALKQGTVDGQENPVATIYTYKYYEAQKYLNLTAHMIRNVVLFTNAGWYNNLPENTRKIIENAMAEATDFNNKLIVEEEADFTKKLQAEGMVVVESDVDAFRKACSGVHKKFEKDWGVGLFEKIQNVK